MGGCHDGGKKKGIGRVCPFRGEKERVNRKRSLNRPLPWEIVTPVCLGHSRIGAVERSSRVYFAVNLSSLGTFQTWRSGVEGPPMFPKGFVVNESVTEKQ